MADTFSFARSFCSAMEVAGGVAKAAMWTAHSTSAELMADAKFDEYCRTDNMALLLDAAILTAVADWCLAKAVAMAPV